MTQPEPHKPPQAPNPYQQQHKVRSSGTCWASWIKTTPVTIGFLMICLAVYLVMLAQTRSLLDTVGGYTATTDQYGRIEMVQQASLGWNLVFDATRISYMHQWWRVFTAAVVHMDVLHISMNAILIFLLGREVERTYGSIAMACTIMAGAAGGSLACMYFQPESPAGGASTVGYALCALLVAVTAQNNQSLRGPIILIAVNLGFSLSVSGISLWGHIGGLIAGVILAIILYNPKARATASGMPFGTSQMVSPARTVVAVIATVITSVASVYIGVNGLYA